MAPTGIYISPEIVNLVEIDEGDELPEGSQEAGVDKNVKLYLSRLTNAVTLNFSFTNIEKLTDLKVTNVAIAMKGAYDLLPVTFDYKPQTRNTVKDWSDESMNGTKFFDAANGYITNADYDYCGTINLTSKEGVAVSGNTLTVYAWMLPSRAALDANGHAFEITLTTNYGTVTASATEKDNKITVKDVKDWTKAPIFTKFGQSGTINVAIDGKAIEVGETEIATQDDLEATLQTLATSGQTGDLILTLKPEKAISGGKFVLEDFTMPEGLQTNVTLEVDGKNATSIAFEGENVINRPLTIQAGVDLNGTMIVKNCVDNKNKQVTTLTLPAWFNINAGAVLRNEGKIEYTNTNDKNPFSTLAADTQKKLPAGRFVSATEDAVFVGSIINHGEIQWIAGQRPGVTDNEGGTIFAEVTDFQSLLAASGEDIEAGQGNVDVVRFMEETTLETNENLTMPSISTIECYAPVTINVKKPTYGAKTTVIFTKVKGVNLKKNASLSVVSDDKANELTLASDATVEGVKGDKSTAFSLNKIKLTNAMTVNNVGAVTLTSVTGTVDQGTGNGTWTEVE